MSEPLPKTSCAKGHVEPLQVLLRSHPFPASPTNHIVSVLSGIAVLAEMETNIACHVIFKLILFSEVLRNVTN